MSKRDAQSAQRRVVRQGGQGRLPPSKLDEEPGPAPSPLRRPPGHRYLQHVVGAHAVQRALPDPGGAGQARSLREGRLPPGIPRDVPGRNPDAPLDDALPQPREHGRGRVHPRQPPRRRGAARRLRQDDSGPAHGRGELRSARDRRIRRSDAERPLPRRADWLRDPRVEVRGDGARRRHVDAGVHGRRSLHVALRGPLHDDGHRLDYGEHGGNSRHGAAGERGHPRRGFAAQRARPHGGTAHRGDGGGRAHDVEESSRARPSRTPSAPTARSAARRTRWCTCWRSREGSGPTSPSTTGTRSGATCPAS